MKDFLDCFRLGRQRDPDDQERPVWAVRLTNGTDPQEQGFGDLARQYGAVKTAGGIKFLEAYFRRRDGDAARDFLDKAARRFGRRNVRMDRL